MTTSLQVDAAVAGAPGSSATERVAAASLRAAAAAWTAVALAGQWAFFYYLIAFYGVATMQGHFESWNRNQMLFNGYVPGDIVGNAVFASHVLLAIVVALGGTLQLVPLIRRRWPAAHRWNGRLYLVAAMLTAAGGIHLSLVRREPDPFNGPALTIDALLIIVFGALAWRAARRRAIGEHREWALRTYIVVNAVWFQRLGIIVFMMTRGALGFEGGMQTFANVWSFGSFVVPLLLLELYLAVHRRGSPAQRLAMAGTLSMITLIMAASTVGLFGFILGPLLRTS